MQLKRVLSRALQPREQIVERGGDLPEDVVLRQRRASGVVAVGGAHVRLQDLLDADVELALLVGQRMLQRRDLLALVVCALELAARLR
jgi:hypothetical protein